MLWWPIVFMLYYIYTMYPYIISKNELNLTIQKMTLNVLSNPSVLRVTCFLPNIAHSVTFRPRLRTYFWYSDKLYINSILYIHKYIYSTYIYIYIIYMGSTLYRVMFSLVHYMQLYLVNITHCVT